MEVRLSRCPQYVMRGKYPEREGADKAGGYFGPKAAVVRGWGAMVVAAFALVVVGCAGGSGSPPAQPTATAQPQPTAVQGQAARPVVTSPVAVTKAGASPAASSGPAATGAQPRLGERVYSDRGLRDVGGETALELTADDFFFEPTFLRGMPGQMLSIGIENVSETQHNFSLAAQRIDQDITPGGRATVQVTFPPSGVVAFFCKLHTDRGMNGQLLTGNATPQAAP